MVDWVLSWRGLFAEGWERRWQFAQALQLWLAHTPILPCTQKCRRAKLASPSRRRETLDEDIVGNKIEQRLNRKVPFYRDFVEHALDCAVTVDSSYWWRTTQARSMRRMRARSAGGCASCPRASSVMSWLTLATLFALPGPTISDFVFPNFFDTTGLIFNGDAYTTSCINNSQHMYGAQQKLRKDPLDPEVRISESTDVRETVTTETNPYNNSEMTYTFFGHREVYDHAPVDEECDNRIRMTASEPHQLSSVWYTQGLEILSGFECSFQFQVTDQSRVCRNVETADFNIYQYQACKVHGGDGFAFVVQSNPNGTATLGKGAEHLGCVGQCRSGCFTVLGSPSPDNGFLAHRFIAVCALQVRRNRELACCRIRHMDELQLFGSMVRPHQYPFHGNGSQHSCRKWPARHRSRS